MKTGVSTLLLPMILLLSSITSASAPSSQSEDTVLRMLPETIQIAPGYSVGEVFSVALVVENVSELYGIDVQLRWNTTYLGYVNHTITVPVENYTQPNPPSPYGGILHAPIFKLKDTVDESASIAGAHPDTMVWLSYSSMTGAPPGGFNGSGTLGVLVFRLKKQTSESIETWIHFTVTKLSTSAPAPIPHTEKESQVLIPGIPPDIMVTQIAVCNGKTIVAQDLEQTITISTRNQGPTDETITLTVYWNDTNTIGSTTLTLQTGEVNDVTFAWEADETAYDLYILGALASQVDGEVNTTNNIILSDPVVIVRPGDVDSDRDVDLFDAVELLSHYGAKVGDPNFNPNLDLNCNSEIFLFDAVVLLSHYGEKGP